MSYTYSKENPNLKRYRIEATIQGEEMVFKRYADSEEKAKTEFLAFVYSKYNSVAQIKLIEEDKTHPVEV